MNDEVKTGEIVTANETTTAVAATAPVSGMSLLERLGAKVVKQVTRTVLQQVDDVPFAVFFETAPIESEVAEVGRGGKAKMAPARVSDVVNIETGAKQILIVNTVLEGELSRAYPNLSFVGKSFLMRSHFPNDASSPTGKKRYKVYEIIEIEVDGFEVTGKTVVADGSDPVNKKGKSV